MPNERSQIVVSLGTGADGEALRALLDEAARRDGKPLSTWARDVLAERAANTPEIGSRERDIAALEGRIRVLEAWRQRVVGAEEMR